MEVSMLVKQAFRLNLGINLSRSNIRMPKHFLHCANVRPSHQQVGGKRVPQAVWAQVLLDTRLSGIILDQDPLEDVRILQGGHHLTNVIKDGKLVALSGVSPEEQIALELTDRLN